ncbi:MAG: TfoX/Sxy family protein [Bermanella sp.]
MAYDTRLAQQVMEQFNVLHPYIAKNMFGGMAIMINGHMCVAVVKDNLVVRVGKERYQQALDNLGVSEFDFTGKPLAGWVYVDGELVGEEVSLIYWLNQGLDFVLSLAPK